MDALETILVAMAQAASVLLTALVLGVVAL